MSLRLQTITMEFVESVSVLENLSELRHLIVEPPFWGCYAAMTIHYTMGGLKISPQAQVLDDADQIIPGLYAAGEAASGIHGINLREQMASMSTCIRHLIAGREAALCG